MADLPDDTRPESADLLAGLLADTRDRTERADALGALDGIDEAMTANYRLTGDAMTHTEPEIVLPSSESRTDLIAGRAVGPVWDDDEWAVEEIVPAGSPEIILTFVSEDAARKHWHETGGQLMRTCRTSWTLAPGWQERAAQADA